MYLTRWMMATLGKALDKLGEGRRSCRGDLLPSPCWDGEG